jgi:hypothetical protein
VQASNGSPSQRWKIIYLDKADKEATSGLNKDFGFHINRPFYLVSRLPMKRVAECVGASNVALKRYVKGRSAQQFFFDGKTKTIRSQQWKNYAVELRGKDIRMTSSINSRWPQMFRYQANIMVNEHGLAWDISNNVDVENRNIIAHTKHGKINQLWDLIYADEYPAEPTKGQLNKEFGFYVQRDFYVVSQLKSNRYLEVIDGRNVVIKTPNNNKGQIWYFDQYSKTVKSRMTNKSLSI